MRISNRTILGLALLLGAWLTGASAGGAQDSEVLMPDQSAAKAQQLVQQAVTALGGDAYLNFHDITCSGRLNQFDHSGELTGLGRFVDYAIPPDKERTENLPQRNIINVFNGDKGWVLDRGGVADAPPSDLARFQGEIEKDITNILRHRIHENGMIFRYGGRDIVDLQEVDWVELVDSEDRTIRIALATATHLPVRKVFQTRDPNTRVTTEEIEYFSNYHPLDGVQTPLQITRERNGIKIDQFFFEKCDYNASIPDSLFSRESLEDRWEKVGKKDRAREKKEQKKEEKDEKNLSSASKSSSSSDQ